MSNLFTEKMEMCISDKVNKIGLENMNTHELGEAIDMVKDTYEMDMLKSKKRYYDTLVEAMNESQYGVDYDEYGRIGYHKINKNRMMDRGAMGYPGQPRDTRGRYTYPEHRMMDMDVSRYGYSHDEYMENRTNATPEQRKQMLDQYMDDLYEMGKDMIMDMTPEEKAIWKAKITKMVNL